jgi:hypothetical protein
MVSPLPRNHAVDIPGNVNNTLAALTGVRVGHATHLDDQSGTRGARIQDGEVGFRICSIMLRSGTR